MTYWFLFSSSENNKPVRGHVAKNHAEGKCGWSLGFRSPIKGFGARGQNDIPHLTRANFSFLLKSGMNTSVNNQFDAIESLIMNEGLCIEALDFHPEQEMMLVILNTKVALNQSLSAYTSLKNADKSQLQQYRLIAGGTGVHWPDLDEDLSLKGFLQSELRKVVKTDKGSVAA